MIIVERYETETGRAARIAPEQVPENLHHEGVLLWVDLQQPDDTELSWLRDTFHFHPLAMDDVQKHQQRAKIDRYEGYYFFVAHSITYDEATLEVDANEIDLFIGQDYLVSIQQAPFVSIGEVHRRLDDAHLAVESTPFLAYLIIDAVVDHYFPIIDAAGDLIDELDAVIIEDPDRGALQKIFRLRRSLLLIRKQIGPLRDALNELIREEESEQLIPHGKSRVYFSDVFDHVLRLTDFVDTYRDMLTGSIDAYQSSLSNVLNINIQRLTVAAMVLATATLITGFFGMNVHGAFINIRWPHTGWIILVVLLVITVVEIWYFKRKGWI